MRLKRPVDTTDYSPTRLLTTGELGVRALLRLAVELEIDTLVEEAEQVANRLGVVLRLRIRPDDVLGRTVARADRPVRRLSLVEAVRLPVGGLEEVEAHVPVGEVVDGEVAGLVQELCVAAVDDGLLREHGANPLRNRIEEEHGSGGRLDVE